MRNVLFCGNSKVFDGVLTCMLSILKRSEIKDNYCFYVMTMNLTRVKPQFTPIDDDRINFLEKTAKKYGENNRVVKLDVTDRYEKEFGHCPNESAYCSPYTLLRLLADLIPEIPDKLLYLDVDVMFNRDISLIYDIDLKDYEYAAARDHYGKVILRHDYINAGVLLLNIKRMRETGILTCARALLRQKKFLFADQTALYKATTKKLMLNQRYNDQKFLHAKTTIIRHFSKRLFYLPYPHTDNIKQWQVEKIHRVFHYTQFDDILNEYRKLLGMFYADKENLTWGGIGRGWIRATV